MQDGGLDTESNVYIGWPHLNALLIPVRSLLRPLPACRPPPTTSRLQLIRFCTCIFALSNQTSNLRKRVMSRPHEKTFSELCRPGSPGYALNNSLWIKSMKMDSAIEVVSKHIDVCIQTISKGWGRQVKKFYIGKSHFNSIRKHRRFSPTNPVTWKLGNGINKRYHDHITHNHGKNGLIVVAVVTKESIHPSHLRDRTIVHQEEYALTLEKRLIQDFKKRDPSRLANRTQESGRTDREASIAYAVYITFTMESELVIIRIDPSSQKIVYPQLSTKD